MLLPDKQFLTLVSAAGYGTPRSLPKKTEAKLRRLIRLVRSQALEDAAAVCDAFHVAAEYPGFSECAHAIRELIEAPALSADSLANPEAITPAKDVGCDGGNHFVGSIATQMVRQSEWSAALEAFARIVDDFNVRGQRDEIPHPGRVSRCRFCPECGAALPEEGVLSFAEALTAVETERMSQQSVAQGI